MFFYVLFQTMVVRPAFTQNVPLPFALGMPGVDEEPSSSRFTSTEQGFDSNGLQIDCSNDHVAGEECLLAVLPLLGFPG